VPRHRRGTTHARTPHDILTQHDATILTRHGA
jgi:hypothetical protein